MIIYYDQVRFPPQTQGCSKIHISKPIINCLNELREKLTGSSQQMQNKP